MVVNKKIRGEVLKMFGLKGILGTFSSTAVTAITRGKCLKMHILLETLVR